MTALCPLCPGEGHSLGALGGIQRYRCRSCGWVFSLDAEEDEDDAPESAGHYADHPELDRDIRVSDYYADEAPEQLDY